MTKLDWEKASGTQRPKANKAKSQTAYRRTLVAKAYANGTTRERERIIKLIQQIHDTWEKPVSFSYRNELQNIIKLIEGKND